nr:unnamed protein product [Spirometra erinaceieuropaei]
MCSARPKFNAKWTSRPPLPMSVFARQKRVLRTDCMRIRSNDLTDHCHLRPDVLGFPPTAPPPPPPRRPTKDIADVDETIQSGLPPVLKQYTPLSPMASDRPPSRHRVAYAANTSDGRRSSMQSQVSAVCRKRQSVLHFAGQAFTKSIIDDPSTNCCLRLCCRGWLAVLRLFIALRAILVRFVFLGLTMSTIATVVNLKHDQRYWFLCLLIIPLLADLCYSIGTITTSQAKQKSVEKWFTKCILAYLLCACPPIWIIELHHLQQLNDATEAAIQQQAAQKQTEVTSNPWTEAGLQYNKPNENLIIMGMTAENFLDSLSKKKSKLLSQQVKEPAPQLQRVRREAEKQTEEDNSSNWIRQGLIQAVTLEHYPLTMRIRIIEQLHLLSVIVGRWMLPRNGLSRDQLSQLLLINIGNAADILELFEAFNEEAVRLNPLLKICILCLWQASLFQFCFNKTATVEAQSPLAKSASQSSNINESSSVTRPTPVYSCRGGSGLVSRRISSRESVAVVALPERRLTPAPQHMYVRASDLRASLNNLLQSKIRLQEGSPEDGSETKEEDLTMVLQTDFTDSKSGCCGGCRGQNNCLQEGHCGYVCFGTELWALFMSLMLQDVPFLGLRLALVLRFNVRSYSNVFFTCKNSLLILLQVFRSAVILQECHRKRNRAANHEIPLIMFSKD